MNNRTIKLISTALLAYFFIMMATAIFGALADDGVILDAWYAMVEKIPFGGELGKFCVELFGNSFNLGNGLSEYVSGIKALTPLEFFEDSMTIILTSVFFEAVDNFLQVLMDIKDRGGIYYAVMQIICKMLAVLVCTFIATLLLGFLCQQLGTLPSIVRGILSIIVSCISLVGAVGVLYFVLGSGIVIALLFVLVKIVLINVLKVGVTYAGILMVILFLGEKAYLKLFTVFAGWGVVIVALMGIDIMLSSVFGHD